MAKSKVVAMKQSSQALALIEQELASEAEDAAAVERPSVGTISIRGGVLSYLGQPIKGNIMECVVLASCHEHRYYTSAFDPDSPVSPVCFALSLTGDAMAPHAAATEKQHTDCNSCPQFAWGSDPKGGRGKACGEVRRLAILPKSALEDENGVQESEVAIMKIPVTSVRNWGNYVNSLRNIHKRPPYAVVTQIEVQPDPRTQIKIVFTAKGLVDDTGLLTALKTRKAGIESLLLRPYEATVEQEGKGAPTKKKGRKF